jgi:cytochrome c oxidase subunit 2
LPDHVAAPIGSDEAAQALRDGPIGALVVASIAVTLLFIGWMASISSSFCREGPLAELPPSPLRRPLPDGIVPEAVVARTERHWVMVLAAMLVVMMAVIVVTGVAGALHPSSNVEVIEPLTLHLGGEFVESNLGTAIEPDGSATVRLIAQQYDFVPHCVAVPADAPVKFRLSSADVVHGFLLPDTNVNTMVVPGFVAEVRTSFAQPGTYHMPCNEFCGLGHHAMWTRVIVVPRDQFAAQGPLERTRCGKR